MNQNQRLSQRQSLFFIKRDWLFKFFDVISPASRECFPRPFPQCAIYCSVLPLHQAARDRHFTGCQRDPSVLGATSSLLKLAFVLLTTKLACCACELESGKIDPQTGCSAIRGRTVVFGHQRLGNQLPIFVATLSHGALTAHACHEHLFGQRAGKSLRYQMRQAFQKN